MPNYMEPSRVFEQFNDIKDQWEQVLEALLIANEGKLNEYVGNRLILSLPYLPVSKKSKFYQSKWDYNDDVLNPSATVRGAKLKLDFSKYNIPNSLLTEMKLLSYVILKQPEVINQPKNNKPNTAISYIKNTLRFLEHTVNQAMIIYGADYVNKKYEYLSCISEGDFENAAKTFEGSLKNSSGIPFLLKFGNTPYAKETLGISFNADAEKIVEWKPKKGVQTKGRKKALKTFTSKQFNDLTKRASFLIFQYLEVLNPNQLLENVACDKLGAKHYPALNSIYKDLTVSFTKEQVIEYMAYRLYSKKWERDYIFSVLPVNTVNTNLRGIEDLKIWLDNVYYACCYIINQFSGMRPNAIAECRFDIPLQEGNGVDLLMSEEHKGKKDNYKLFDDAYPLTPLMKDAWLVAKEIATMKANHFLFSSRQTIRPGQEYFSSSNTGQFIQYFFDYVYPNNEFSVNSYTCRHSLAKELYRADVGLPVISYILKHVVEGVNKYSSEGAMSSVTLSYGDIAKRVEGRDKKVDDLRKLAEIEQIKETLNPNAIYLGDKANEHKQRLTKAFEGYLAAGYSEDEIYEAMVEQGIALLNVGTGMCMADDALEDFDESIPCIGSLRCNPIRCKNSVITEVHIPKWEEVYMSNVQLIGHEDYENRQEQILAIIDEAKSVLEHLGVEVA
ncbi:hypothetical protein [Vibrio aestuarianus]|uniref:hypothetical protein n=1 Tax=Vibrio aestuarianus TaxID=28171 RepID=UPI001593A348|nr:hypothetical protein [Vibrio aestuarianus]MDE1233936.1 hypothetical protein [Vibrio aestuarianus]MDE1244813.1 hypothetical protein [Vibrio aestuarianus]NGZ62053.1 hypothetical protein [Vibrio aestuarianus subsp. cardii]